MFVSSQTGIASSLLLSEFLNSILEGKVAEKPMLAAANLIVNTALGAIKALTNGELKRLDPNPGDGGCQMRAYLLFLWIKRGVLIQEADSLEKKMKAIFQSVNTRNALEYGRGRKKPEGPSQQFFKKQFEEIAISKEMLFLLQCHLLAVTRQPYARLPSGIVMTRTEVSLLSLLSKKIDCVPLKERWKITEKAQEELSAASVAFLRDEAGALTSFGKEEKEHLLQMLSPEMTKVFTPDPKFLPKTFGCLFYECKAVLYRLREEEGLVCFKSIVTEGKPFHLFFQSDKPGEEFSLVSEEAIQGYPSTTLLVVFEGVTALDKENCAVAISSIGFTTLFLSEGAIEAQYERTSTIEDVKDQTAKEEILSYRALTGSVIVLDHIYCNTLFQEIGRQNAKAT